VRLIFPGVARRFFECAEWHQEKYGFTPIFGLFFCLCINATFPGQKRVHCHPHADSKNVVGVCASLIYCIPGAFSCQFKNKLPLTPEAGKPFDHKRKTWLVLWEAGVIIELPPWVAAIYPSSLLYHFHVDISGE
jgi:hypothetical protein